MSVFPRDNWGSDRTADRPSRFLMWEEEAGRVEELVLLSHN